MRLHLGCGQRYLDGYVNVDYPQSERLFAAARQPDRFADLSDLSFEAGSADEVRLHHVFEHFTRPVACAFLVAWRTWLKPQGRLRIEVPDFTTTALAMLNPLGGLHAECVGARHLFGSNEAAWANHLEGWSGRRLTFILEQLEYRVVKVRRDAWRGTYNLEVFAVRSSADLDLDVASRCVREFLAMFLVDASADEVAMLDEWMRQYDRQLARSTGRDGAR